MTCFFFLRFRRVLLQCSASTSGFASKAPHYTLTNNGSHSIAPSAKPQPSKLDIDKKHTTNGNQIVFCLRSQTIYLLSVLELRHWAYVSYSIFSVLDFAHKSCTITATLCESHHVVTCTYSITFLMPTKSTTSRYIVNYL